MAGVLLGFFKFLHVSIDVGSCRSMVPLETVEIHIQCPNLGFAQCVLFFYAIAHFAKNIGQGFKICNATAVKFGLSTQQWKWLSSKKAD